MSELNFLANNGFICVSKDLIKKFGLNCAVMIGELASLQTFYSELNKLDEDGMFYLTSSTCYTNTGLSYYELNKVIDTLKDIGVIEISIKGLPARRFIKLNKDNLLNILNDANVDLIEKNEKADFKNLNSTNENLEINNNISNNIKENKNIVNDLSFTTTVQATIESSIVKQNSFTAFDPDALNSGKSKKDINPNTTKRREYLVDFIKSLEYNDSIKDILLKWYFNVAVGKISVSMLRDKLKRLSEYTKSDNDIYESINNSYINSWLAFYPLKKNNSRKVTQNCQGIERVKEEDKFRNPDGSYMVY